jgi:nitrogen fixation protein FixH
MATQSEPSDAGRITGLHVLAMFVAGFGAIVAVNLTLAYNAVRTFPGLETESSYVASQAFQADRAAQEALGWDVSATLTEGALRLAILGPDGAPVRPAALEATLGRPTHVADDIAPDLRWRDGALVAPVDLAPGLWTLRLAATAGDGTAFRRTLQLRAPR